MDQGRKRGAADDEGGSPTAAGKRSKRDVPEEKASGCGEEEVVETDKQLRNRNEALRNTLEEKNRRIAFLETKCSELFVHRHALDTRMHMVLNHWSSLLSTLQTLLPDTSRDAGAAIEGISAMPVALPEGIQCDIDEWYQSGTEPTSPELPAETALDNNLRDECDYVKGFVSRLLSTMTCEGAKVEETEALSRAIDAKNEAERATNSCKELLAAYKQQLHDVKRDLSRKELERHQACRDLDRLKQLVPAGALDEAKAEAAKPETPADSKATLEKLEKLQNEVRRATAAETVMKHSIASLKTLHEEQLTRVTNDHGLLKEEYHKFKLKCKDMETHIHEKWKKKLAKYQADGQRVRAKMDELTVKNAELRSRLTTYSAYKDQMAEYKLMIASYERQVAGLKEQLKGTEKYRQYVIDAKEALASATITTLQGQLAALQASHEALQKDIANGDLAETSAREQAARDALVAVEAKLLDTESALDTVGRQLELRKEAMVNHEVELNAIVLEVDVVNREAEAMREQMKKTLTKLREKESAMAKLAQATAKLEQANAFSFDELAGVRLQVAALQGLQKQHKALEQGFNDVMKQKEDELLSLQMHVAEVLKLKDDLEKDKLRAVRELEFVKLTAAQPKPDKPATPPPCEHCHEAATKAKEARAAGPTPEMTELERYELNDLRKKMRCSVCQDHLKEVIVAKCMHMFCKECMDSNLKARNRKCPTCKKMFGQDDVKGVYWS
ncbi:hypothetical protein ACHHYP_16032 [Achlya hypogyna]|uniref:E3 ubiquitin protein ligase n=1 Tax=Achlya hypogyna TaxID=1202772 RepID=A0A1V9Y9P4_ACHHY|nr:hypothetical protein ACHHYP_16032 [Achlya hypogyna]